MAIFSQQEVVHENYSSLETKKSDHCLSASRSTSVLYKVPLGLPVLKLLGMKLHAKLVPLVISKTPCLITKHL